MRAATLALMLLAAASLRRRRNRMAGSIRDQALERRRPSADFAVRARSGQDARRLVSSLS